MQNKSLLVPIELEIIAKMRIKFYSIKLDLNWNVRTIDSKVDHTGDNPDSTTKADGNIPLTCHW